MGRSHRHNNDDRDEEKATTRRRRRRQQQSSLSTRPSTTVVSNCSQSRNRSRRLGRSSRHHDGDRDGETVTTKSRRKRRDQC